jgi:hypothetical protein
MDHLAVIDADPHAVDLDDHYGVADREDHGVVDDDVGGEYDHDHGGESQAAGKAGPAQDAAAKAADATIDGADAQACSNTAAAIRSATNLQMVDDPVSREHALDQLAVEVNQHHSTFICSIRTSLDHARAAGCTLRRAKNLLSHGEWTAWVQDHCKFSLRTAQKYLSLARMWNKLAPNAPPTALFTIDGLLSTVARKGGRLLADSGSVEEPDTDGQIGDDNDANTAPPQTRLRADPLKEHQERCRRLRALSRTHLLQEHQVIKANVNAGIGALFKEIVTVIRAHASRQCTRAVKKCGGDVTLMAMALTAELRGRLDPVEIFAPKKLPPTKQGSVDIENGIADQGTDNNGNKPCATSSVCSPDDIGEGG